MDDEQGSVTSHGGLEWSLSTTVLDSPDPPALGAFYRDLLGWRVVSEDPTWVMLRPPGGGSGLSVQLEPLFVRPTWPSDEEHQQMMSHLDIRVSDMPAGVRRAVELGAREAETQPQDDVRVMLDPDGHPFCLFEN